MIEALTKTIGDMTSPEFRSVLWKAIGLSVVLFVGLWFGIEFLVSALAQFPWPWLTTALQVTTGLGLFAAFFFLMAPVTALFAGLFQDSISAKVEAQHYPLEIPGKPLAFWPSLGTALRFTAVALAVNIVVLPLSLFMGFGVLLFILANTYLISREYFEMAAARHMPMAAAIRLRHEHQGKIMLAGIIPGVLSVIPFINFATPVFATAYFVHLFKGLGVTWVPGSSR